MHHSVTRQPSAKSHRPHRRSLTTVMMVGLVGWMGALSGCGNCTGQATLTHTASTTQTRIGSERQAEAKAHGPVRNTQPLLARATDNPVVAQVGDDPIHRAQIEQAFQETLRLRALTGRPVTASWRSHTRRKLLHDAVETLLLDRAVTAEGIVLSERDVSHRMQHQIETRFRTRATLERYLSKLGISEHAYRQQLRRELALERLLQRRANLTVTPEQVRAWYDAHPESFQARERVHLATIILRVPRSATSEDLRAIKQRAASIAQLSRKRRKQTFQDLAQRTSEGPTAADGGDVGWNYRHTLPIAIAKPAFTLPIGAVSEPIQTRLGIQIIKVLDRRHAGTRGFDEVQDSLARQLRAVRTREARRDLITQLKQHHPIRIHEERLLP